MSNEQPNTETEQPTKFGRESVEQSQNFEKMPLAFPDPPKDLADFPVEEETSFGPKEAAEFVAKRCKERQEAAPAEVTPSQNEPLPRAYIHYGGEHSGEPRPSNETIELDRASRDLSGIREVERTAEAAQLDADLAAAVDALRAGDGQQQPEQQQPQPQPNQQPAEPQPALEGDDAIFQNPRVIQALETYNQQMTGAVQQAQQQYEAAVSQNALAAAAGLIAQFPELQGLNTQQEIQAAIQAVQRTNPQRGSQITEYIGRVRGLMTEAQRVQDVRQAQAAQYYQQQQTAALEQFQKAAEIDDNQFDDYARSQGLSDQHLGEIRREARALLRDYGLSDQQVAALWNSDPVFRSLPAQKLILDATRYRMSVAAARGKAVRPVPIVQRPGSPAARGNEEDYNLGKLSAELNRTGSAKTAAALLTARRSGRR